MKTLKIIKIGGNIINNENELYAFLEKFAALEGPKVLVHGGGKLATSLSQQMNVKVNIKEGRRITDAATLDIITMSYAGKINKQIVARLQAHQCNAIGFSGADGNTIVATKRPVKEIDYGFVGDIQNVHTETLDLLLNNHITPVFCAITHDAQGQLLNTNADTIASELAIAFSKSHQVSLYYCFEKPGVLTSIDDENSIIKNITTKSYKTLINQGVITDGMIPKLDNCFYAIQHNVHNVCIGVPAMVFDATIPHTLLHNS